MTCSDVMTQERGGFLLLLAGIRDEGLKMKDQISGGGKFTLCL